jgi:hypothetical protein
MKLPDQVVIGRKETHITGKNTKQDGAQRDREEAKSFPDCANTTFFFSLSMNKIEQQRFHSLTWCAPHKESQISPPHSDEGGNQNQDEKKKSAPRC